MSEQVGFLTQLGREIKDMGKEVGQAWRRMRIGLHNASRQYQHIDYIVMPLSGTFPERSGPPRSFLQRQLPLPPEPLSMQMLNGRFQQIADATNVKGVVLILKNITAGFATLQNLRRSVERLRSAGKEVIVFADSLDNGRYLIATAADRIIVPPSAEFGVYGLRIEALFLKEALAKIGVDFDNIQISPYKTASNMFDKADITPEQREQLNWLLDETFDLLTAAIADGPGLSQNEVKELIDRAPIFPEEAKLEKLIDDIAYEDELAYLLAPPIDEDEEPAANNGTRPQANLVNWAEGQQLLTRKYRQLTSKYIGVVSLEGLIMMGQSTTPPIDLPIPFIGGSTAGETTLTQILREAEQDEQMAALIFHVDSGGGSALASDLIGRQVERLSRKKPVLVYMGNTAASGGYYVSAMAQHIMSQSGTLTGSIGVVLGRPNTKELYEKVGINRVGLMRGKRANLFTDEAPLTEEERQVFWEGIVHVYNQFKEIVAKGRNIPFDELDEICEGRVWTGRQAAEHQLVDSHGDFVDAIYKTAALANLTINDHWAVPVVNLFGSAEDYQLPQPYEAAEELLNLFTAARLKHLQEPLALMPFEVKLLH
ncbi:MAG: signal peptide peptidase SppA [Anaerolineales bacterium]|nr:signal peptide peptidase SppA [Anaerolineales bacterium]